MYHQVIVLGVLIAVIFAEFTNLSPAGLVVPGYIVLNLGVPSRIVSTLVVVFLTLGVIKFLDRYAILYGRRTFAAMLAVSFLFVVLSDRLGLAQLNVIGCVIPGIMANECHRQGVVKTLLSLSVVSAFMVSILLLLQVRIPGVL